MGWPDHYTSRTFVNIYLIGIERYLEQSLSKANKKIGKNPLIYTISYQLMIFFK